MSRYVESAVLRVTDDASKTLSKITANYRKFAKDIARLNGKMATGANAPFGSGTNATAAGLRAQIRALDQGARAADRYAAAMARAATSAKATAAASRTQAAMQRQVQRLNATTGAGGYAPRPGKGGKGGAVAQGFKFGLGAEMAHRVERMIVNAAHVVVEGAKEGSGARAAFDQSGNTTSQAFLDKTIADFARRYGSNSADITRQFAEVSPFSHDPKIQRFLVEQIEVEKSHAVARGETADAAHKRALLNFKAFDMQTLFRPDPKTGEIDTKRAEAMMQAVRNMQAAEGKNLAPGDFKNLMKYIGPHGATLSAEGAQQLISYSTDVSGNTAGVQQRAVDRLLAGINSGGTSKVAIANAIREGFAVRNKDGSISAANFERFNAAPMAAIAEQGMKRMRERGLDPNKTEDVKKYAESLKFNSQVTTYLTNAINRYYEQQRAVEAAKHANVTKEAAEQNRFKYTTSSLDALNNSAKSLGAQLDKGGLGNAFRSATNAATDFTNRLTARMAEGKAGGAEATLAAAIVGLTGVAAAIKENPLLSANTAALWANTAAQRKGALGGLPGLVGGAGAASGVTGIAARLIAGVGIGSIIAAAGYVAYKGMGGGESPAVNAKTAEIVGLENRIKNLQDALGRDQSPEKRADLEGKLATAANSLEKAMGELVSLRQTEAAARTTTASVSAAEAALPATLGNLDQRQGELTAAIKALEAKIPTLEQMPGSTQAERNAAGPTGAAAQLAKLNGELAQVREAIGRREAEQVRGDQSGFKEGKTAAAAKQISKAGDDAGNKVKAAMDAGAQKFDGAGQKITAASAKFDATMQQVGPKIESAGTNAGNSMQRAIEAGGAAAAAKIGQAVSNISVNVNAPKASAPTGASAPGRS